VLLQLLEAVAVAAALGDEGGMLPSEENASAPEMVLQEDAALLEDGMLLTLLTPWALAACSLVARMLTAYAVFAAARPLDAAACRTGSDHSLPGSGSAIVVVLPPAPIQEDGRAAVIMDKKQRGRGRR
jgi:hypothetical protein